MTDNIQTARLRLRRLQESDREAVTAIAGDLAVSRWLAVVPHPYAASDFDDFLDIARADPLLWMIEHDGRLVGAISGGDALGYWLAPAVWGRGLMTEAAQPVIARSFDAPTREAMLADVHDGNAASARVLAKLGFVVEGPVTSTCRALNRSEVPARRMRLTRADWAARHA